MIGSKPNAVFDTGIILQATISDTGPAARALRLFEEGAITLFVSPELLLEMRQVLMHPMVRPKNTRYADTDIDALLDRLAHKGSMITSLPAHFQCERDPEDDHVINLAIEAKAEYLVTRDKDILGLMNNAEFRLRYPNITVLDPAVFLRS